MESKENTIHILSNINELYATTQITQYFTNTLQNSIELKVEFPIKEEISLSKFVVTMGDKLVISKVMGKQKAEEKYNDTLASGKVGFLSKLDENKNNYTVYIGNLKPNQQIKLISIFIQMIGTQDMSYEFNIMQKYPTFHYKEMNKNKTSYKTINADFEISTQSKITRLIAPFLDEEAKKTSSYSVKYSPDYKTAKIKYIKNYDTSITNNDDDYYDSRKDNSPMFYSSFCILFRTEKMNKPVLYYQYNPILKETSYSLNYTYISDNLAEIPIPEKPDEDNTISYIGKYEDNAINETPGLFVFLIDQSGSMSGRPIELVKQALLLFIQSLPAESYFQLIGFGSSFQKYNKEPVIYNKENIENIIQVINGLKANLGGTNIVSPLSSIYSDKCYDKINLSKNIFLLTDGEVNDTDECINIINNNASKFKVHALGIGSYFDKILIERCGKVGKGTSSFIEDIGKINSVVIDILNKCLRPYIIDTKFEIENYKDELSAKIISCNPINNFTYQNEIINYSFILPNKIELSNLKIKLTGKDPINNIESDLIIDNIIKLEDSEEMGKMIVGKALKYNEELINDEKKEIEFAKKYQILSKNTSIFAEILNEDNQQSELIQVNLNNKKEIIEEKNSKVKNEIEDDEKLQNNDEDEFDEGGQQILDLMNNRELLEQRRREIENILRTGANIRELTNEMEEDLRIQGGSIDNIESHITKADDNVYSSSPIDIKVKKDYSSPKKEKKSKNTDKMNKLEKEKENFNKIIMSQDFIEGFWNENKDTKTVIDIITLDKFNKIKNLVKPMNKGANEIKIIYTIIVIYFLNIKLAEKLNEYRLVINKGKKFLKKNGINYDNIISGI